MPLRPRFALPPLLSILALLALGLAGPAHGRPAAEQGPRASLEELLARLREAREARLAPMRAEVEQVARRLEELGDARGESAAPAEREHLARLGPEAAPLLVPWLEPSSRPGPVSPADRPAGDPGEDPARETGDPGPEVPASARFRARQFALALRQLPTPAVTDDLLRMARNGTPEGQRNALVALAGNPEAQRVRPVLRGIYESGSAELRLEALAALASFPGSAEVFVAALGDRDARVVEVALAALVKVEDTQLAHEVIGLLRSAQGASHLRSILAYFKAAPQALDEPALTALAEILIGDDLRADAKVDLLDTLSRLPLDLDAALKKQMEPLTRSSSTRVAESAMILLARHRDSKSRRRLLDPYDDAVNGSRSRPNVYTERASIYYRIGDLRAATKDYKRALELGRNKGIDEAPFLGLARCYALQGRFKEAAEYLDRAPISIATLHELAQDPDFAEMIRDKRGRQSFRLPDEEAPR